MPSFRVKIKKMHVNKIYLKMSHFNYLGQKKFQIEFLTLFLNMQITKKINQLNKY